MIKELIKLSNELDLRGLKREADYLDQIIKAASDNPDEDKTYSMESIFDQLARDLNPNNRSDKQPAEQGLEQTSDLESSEDLSTIEKALSLYLSANDDLIPGDLYDRETVKEWLINSFGITNGQAELMIRKISG
tara:strand:+ start:343 stop:744 length:402 start_codon:yes stop_codon:yes gene_type:complete